MPVSNKVEITHSDIHGYCWRAKEDIGVGEMIWEAAANEDSLVFTHHKDEVATWPQDRQTLYQIGPGVFRGPYGKDTQAPVEVLSTYYINHCCDGNMWYATNDKLLALKEIKKGEELCYDYALTETEPTFTLNCLCKKELCRGVMKGTDYQNKDLQKRYGNHFLPHVLKQIEIENKK